VLFFQIFVKYRVRQQFLCTATTNFPAVNWRMNFHLSLVTYFNTSKSSRLPSCPGKPESCSTYVLSAPCTHGAGFVGRTIRFILVTRNGMQGKIMNEIRNFWTSRDTGFRKIYKRDKGKLRVQQAGFGIFIGDPYTNYYKRWQLLFGRRINHFSLS
jgi:hypothetical protein